MSSGPKTFLYISSVFLWSLIGNFLSFFLHSPTLRLGIFSFCFLLLFWLGISFLFLFSSEGKDRHSHPGSRFMVNWDFASRLVARMDMIYVRVWWNGLINFGFSNFQNRNVFRLSSHPCYLSAPTVLLTMLYYFSLPLIFWNNVWSVLCMWWDCSTMFLYMVICVL